MVSYPDLSSRSAALFQRAQAVQPGGNTRLTIFSLPYQLYAESGSGYLVRDVDGVERIDFQNNYTALIHGHAHPMVTEKVVEQARKGVCFGLATESDVELAEILCSRVPSFEKIRFVNSGTEAAISAAKASRAYTGRTKIAKCEGAYHGGADYFDTSVTSGPENWNRQSNWGAEVPASVPESRGTSKSTLHDVVVIPFNQPEAAEAILRHHADELAAVIVDPMPPRVGLIAASHAYLQMLRRFTQDTGSVLIFDEVISFRLGYRGAQGVIGINPDITMLGKFIGGGFPVGALAGKSDIMSVFDPSAGRPAVALGGTFNANPITMTAGAAAMRLMNESAFARIGELGEQARRGIAQAFRDLGVDGQVTGQGSLFRVHFSSRKFTDYRSTYPTPEERKKMAWFMNDLINRGILLTNMAMGSISTVMDESVIERLVTSVRQSLSAMKNA